MILTPNPQDSIHKAWLYKLLSAIIDDPFLSQHLVFKGGTCASMLGYLSRFSVDLDFDLQLNATDLKKPAGKKMIAQTKMKLEYVAADLDLQIKDASVQGIQYFFQYPAKPNQRNTIKVDVTFPQPEQSVTHVEMFPDINRMMYCQTIEAMFANKLVAVLDRFEKNHSIAGRDIFDIHTFFLNGYRYHIPIIEARRKTSVVVFFQELIDFIETHITDKILRNDLNVLLPAALLKHVPTLKQETLMLLNDELQRLQ